MVVGFLGAGNMAGAIVKGVVNAGVLSEDDIVLHAASTRRSAPLAEQTGARLASSAEQLVADCDVVVLAIKPQVLPEVVAELHDAIATHRPLLVSIAAGVDLKSLATMLPGGIAVVRVMPNVNAMVGAGMAAICGNESASEQDVARIQGLFDAVGDTVVLPECDFSAFTAIAGSAPAFVFTFIEALARGGVDNGLPKALATRIAAQMMLGSATTVLAGEATGTTPADLTDTVCSPAGTTVAGLLAMEEAGFSPAVVRGVEAVIARDKALGAG